MVTQWQNLFYEDRYSHTHQQNPDFMKLADAMGVQHQRVSKPDDLVDSLKWLINTDGPALLEVITDKKVPVLPMVPGGFGLHEFITWNSSMFIPLAPIFPTVANTSSRIRSGAASAHERAHWGPPRLSEAACALCSVG